MEVKYKEKKELNLHQKLSLVRKHCSRIPKNGYNDFHRYPYVMEGDVCDYLRELLSGHGIDFHVSVESHERIKDEKAITEIVEMRFDLINADNPEERISSIFWGEGQDRGDKAFYKAYTGGLKYFLLKTFLLSSGDDPEADTETDKRSLSMPKPKAPQPKAPDPQASDQINLNEKIVGKLRQLVGDDMTLQKKTFSMASAFINEKTGEVKTLKSLMGSESWKRTAYGKLKKLCQIPDVQLKVAEKFKKEIWELTPEERDHVITWYPRSVVIHSEEEKNGKKEKEIPF